MKNDELLDKARKRYADAVSAEDEMREAAIEDLRFKIGEQWPEEERREREKDKRPMLRINKLQQHIKQIVNQQRQARPGVKVRPVDSDGDPMTARVMEGYIRNIETVSNAEAVYDMAFEQAVDAGFGYYRITTEYATDYGFDQEIFIRPVKNRFSVLFDPKCEQRTKEDAMYAFVYDEMRREDAEDLYGDKIEMSHLGEGAKGTSYQGWWTKDNVRITEYFYKEKHEKLLVLFDSGDVIEVPDEIDGESVDPKDFIEAHEMASRAKYVRERVVDAMKVKWCRMTGTQVLEKKDWAGLYIPIVPVMGDSTHVEGRDYVSGLIRWAKDPVMAYNYWMTAATENIALAPKAPFIIADGQLSEYKNWWKNANRKNLAFLPYKPVNGVPPPQRVAPPQTPSALMNMLSVASDDLKATTGIYDASLGARGNETSGIAIAERQEQGDVASFHYVDNLNSAIGYGGKILVDLIPRIVDTERVIRVLNLDGTDELQKVNTVVDGKKVFDLSAGRYDVVTEAGPSFATKRQEAADLMLEVIKTNPAMMQMMGDMLFKNLDIEGAEELAQRFAKIVPPELTGDGEQGGMPGGVPPEMMAQLQGAVQ